MILGSVSERRGEGEREREKYLDYLRRPDFKKKKKNQRVLNYVNNVHTLYTAKP